MAKPRGVVEPSMVAVSVNEYVGETSPAGYYEVSLTLRVREKENFREKTPRS